MKRQIVNYTHSTERILLTLTCVKHISCGRPLCASSMSSISSAKLKLQLAEFTPAIQFVVCILYHSLSHDVEQNNDSSSRVHEVVCNLTPSDTGILYTATTATTACREYGEVCVKGIIWEVCITDEEDGDSDPSYGGNV